MKNEVVFLSLGSNLGDRESNLAQAAIALSINYQISDIVSSSYYESEPLYNTNQPFFLNSILQFSTTLKPFDVFDLELAPEFNIPHTNLMINDLLENCPDKSSVKKYQINSQA